MILFETDPIDLPPVSITHLEDDEEGQKLLDTLDRLRTERQEADAEAREARRPLSDLMAEADELAARAMAGDADPEDADEAEAKVQETKDQVERYRRRIRQCDRAIELVKQKIDARESDLYARNAEAVAAVHRVLTRHALQAERRAAALLRLLREFEVRYARYASGDAAEDYPRYLPEHVRTSPSRSIMGPVRTPGGNVFDRADATAWMRRAAEVVDADPPAIIDLTSVNFESDDARLETLTPDDLDADALDDGPADSSSRAAAPDVTEESKTDVDEPADESPAPDDPSTDDPSTDDPSTGNTSEDPATESSEAPSAPHDDSEDSSDEGAASDAPANPNGAK